MIVCVCAFELYLLRTKTLTSIIKKFFLIPSTIISTHGSCFFLILIFWSGNGEEREECEMWVSQRININQFLFN